ncbi:MAG: DUF2974 domain-containing protein [Sphaerochaetaceae bacterium]|nr:DUF2974 domain-containing protein [Sphaerochaetaceae bacterium]
MNATYDYLYWRGDIPFSKMSFNEIDGLVFALLSNIEYSTVFKDLNVEEKISLTDVVEIFRDKNVFENLSNLSKFEKQNLVLIQDLCHCRRYSTAKLFGYQKDFRKECYTQFSAISFILDDDTVVASYRGTDCSLVGWKEDFAMSFKTEVGAQTDSVSYINFIGRANCKQLITCGHSKGGNLAVYSALKAKSDIQDKIAKVYNFDGPGFNKKVVRAEDFQKIGVDKIITIVPQSSIVGILMQHGEPINVVYSSNKTGIFQHYPLTWEVEPTHFRRLEGTDNLSKNFDETTRIFLENMNEEEMATFTDAIFEMFDKNGAITLRDVMRNPANTIKTMHQVHKEIPEEYRRILGLLGKAIIKASIQIADLPSKRKLFFERKNASKSFSIEE